MPADTKEETRAGSYFVSNYPPYSCWSGGAVEEVRAALDRPAAAGTPLGVYLHIPFCRKRCHFCYFRVYTDKNAADIRRYLDAVVAELRLYARAAFLAGRRPSFVYFGGGTPSYLSVAQLRHLASGMKELLPWDRAEEVTFECEPGTLTEGKLEAIREMGVTRLSLGIEHWDDEILAGNGRAHRSPEIGRAWAEARSLGFPQINLDLIAGMVGDTEEKWRDAVERTLELSPDSVTIYQMEVPFNTTLAREMKAHGAEVAPVADWPTKRRWVGEAFEAFERAGYQVASAYTVVKDAGTRFVYRDRLWAGADLIPLGVSSFGHIGGTHLQNLADFETYLRPLAEGHLPWWRGYTPSSEERMIRELVLQLKLGRLSAAYFERKFGVDPRVRFREPLEELAGSGLAALNGEEIRLSREALLQVDGLLSRFFLPEHRNVRYS